MHVCRSPGRGGAGEVLAVLDQVLQFVRLGLLVVQAGVVAHLQAPGNKEKCFTLAIFIVSSFNIYYVSLSEIFPVVLSSQISNEFKLWADEDSLHSNYEVNLRCLNLELNVFNP